MDGLARLKTLSETQRRDFMAEAMDALAYRDKHPGCFPMHLSAAAWIILTTLGFEGAIDWRNR